MGSKSSTTKAEPWKEVQPFILDTAEAGAKLFEKGKLSPDNVGFGATSKDAQERLKALGRENAITEAATGGLGDFLGATRFAPMEAVQYGDVAGPREIQARRVRGPQSYGPIAQNAGIDAVRNSVLDTVLPEVAGMFGRGGFTNSTTAQQVATNAATSALAPYEYDQYNRNRALDIDQFNTDENRRLAFAVNERDTQLNQANLNDARAVDFGLNLRDRQVAQGNTGLDQAYRNELAGAQTFLSGLGMAPQVNALQYGDVNALMGLGQIRDQNRQANKDEAANEVLAAANLFGGLGGLGSVQTAPGPSTAGSILGGGAAGLGAYGALLGSGVGTPLAVAGGLAAGLGSIF